MVIFSQQTKRFLPSLVLLGLLVLPPAGTWAQEIETRQGLDPIVIKADQLIRAGKGDAASAILNEYNSQHPRQPQILVRMADIATRHWNFQTAQRYLEQALRVDPTNTDALAVLGHLYYEESINPLNPVDRMAKSRGYLNQALTLNPNHVRSLTYMGDWSLAENDTVSAERNYRQAIALNPQFVPAYQGLAQFHIKSKDFAQARDAVTQALELDNHDSTTYFLVAQLLGVSDHPAEAVKYAQQSEMLDFGKDINRDFFLASQLDKLGESQQAIAYYRKVLAEYPHHATSLERLGHLYEALQQPEQSLNAYQQAIGSDPGVLDKLKQQARQAIRQENWQGALDQWQRIRRMSPNMNTSMNMTSMNMNGSPTPASAGPARSSLVSPSPANSGPVAKDSILAQVAPFSSNNEIKPPVQPALRTLPQALSSAAAPATPAGSTVDSNNDTDTSTSASNIDAILCNIQYAQGLAGQPITPVATSHLMQAIKQSLATPGQLPGDLSVTQRAQLTSAYSDPNPVNRLEAAFLAGDYQTSKTVLESIDGLSIDAYQDAGDRLFMLRDNQAARTFYQRALEFIKAETPPTLGSGDSNRADSQGSLVTALKRIEQHEKNAQRLIADGNLLYDIKKFPAAIQKYEEALRQDPLSETAYLRLGDAYERNHQKDRAFWAYREVVSLNPNLLDSKGFSKKYHQLEKSQPKK